MIDLPVSISIHDMILASGGAPKSDFGKAVADAYRGIRGDFEKKPFNEPGVAPTDGQVDRSVREQVISDIDSLIEKNDAR